VSNEVSQGFRLSPQQRQAWAARQAGAPAAARCAVRIEGPLRAATLEAALRQTVERHEILRTEFHSLPGMKFPVQVVGVASVSWEAVALRDVEAAEQQGIVAQLFGQTGPRGDEADGMDARVARVRASLLGLSDERHVLLLSLPALATDERALENLTAELSRRYAAGVGAGEEADDPVQYVQFSEWQNELLEDEADAEAGAGREFWRRQLSHGHAAPRLPFERPAAGAGFETASVAFELGSQVLRDAEAVTRAEDTTVESALLAGWHALLWHLLRHETMIVYRRFDGRKFDELHDAVGLYDAELPAPVTLEEGEESLAFSRLVHRVGDIVRDGERWQEYFPWPPGEGRGSFAYGFDYAEAARPHAVAGVIFTLAERRVGAARFKLKLRCTRHPDKLAAELQYDADLYERADVELLARQYAQLLGDALAAPRRAVSRLSVVGPDERRRVLEELNDTREEFPDGVCFHELFEAQAARSPETTAVVCEDERLTYGELNARANRLARHLRALGTGPESRVALLAERSAQTVVALLAVLKAGGAYVPLDSALPPARLASMLEDSGATVLIRERRPAGPGVDSVVAPSDSDALSNSADPITDARGVTVVCLDADAGAIAAGSAENLGIVAADHNLAYVIYTSGSTGRPKGVAVEHRQLSNYVHTIRQRLALPAPANYAIVSTFAADLGHTMTFPALASGGALHVISHERSADAPALADYFSRHEIDCLKIVPSHLAALLASDDAGRVLPRRRLVLGGEPAPPELAARVCRLAPACRVFNHYGPTETTVGVLTHEVAAPTGEVVTGGEPDSTTDEGGARETAARRTLPLGRAIANARVYLLDAELQPVPFGAPGELHVAGAPVARGYLNHAAATAEKFVPDPFAAEPGARLYRTGDVARFLPGGSLEFLGRRDHQVKIRGYRVELGEVETAVRRHAGVRECVVVARGVAGSDESGSDSANGERRIVAYVVAQRGQRPSVAELRAAVHGWLPEYMTPSAFVVLDKLPLTPNGKVDLRALPSPEETRAQPGREYVAPRTDLEDVLAGLWAEVLGCERVGVRDNFFELGGHSLLAMRITSRLREIFRVELQLRALFEATTVEDLARALTASEAKPGQFESVARVLKKIKGMSAAGVRETLQARKS
jgi:amino acid adenylation domain-containing protein